MTKLVSNGLRAMARPKWILGLAGIVIIANHSVAAPQEQPAVAAGEGTQVVSLEYREVGWSLMSYSIPVNSQSVSFKRQPDFGQRKVVRGSLEFGRSASNAVAFAWDKAEGKLYLDLNRDLELSADGGEMFTRADKRSSSFFQSFTNVHFSFNTDSGVRRLLVDVNVYDYGRTPHVSAALRSCWQGKGVLSGTEFQVGIVETDRLARTDAYRSGYLLVRPWERRDQRFDLAGGGLDAFRLPTNLFFQGQVYRVRAAFDAGATPAGYKLELTEQSATLGEVEITGQFINRLVLEGGPYTVVLDSPGRTVKVPVGTYSTMAHVSLKQGDVEAYQYSAFGPAMESGGRGLVVGTNMPAVIALGGPLTNSVSVKRRGDSLQLSYELLGGGGQKYQLTTEDRSKPPEFVVYKAGKKIASGKFEYG